MKNCSKLTKPAPITAEAAARIQAATARKNGGRVPKNSFAAKAQSAAAKAKA